MTNFDIFNQQKLEMLLEPFFPGAAAAITAIAYHSFTPDIFGLLFRTIGRDNRQYYFVSLEYDYLTESDEVKEYINEWLQATVEELIPPAAHQDTNDLKSDNDLAPFTVKTSGPYYGLMVRISRPMQLGYWSNNIVLQPGDDITDKMAGFSVAHMAAIKRFIADRSHGTADEVTHNTTDLIISVFRNHRGGMEMFFNHARSKPAS